MKSLENKTVLVTGGSRGIGRAIALAMAEEGANVAVLFAGNRAAADQTAAEIAEKGVKVAVYQCDVASCEETENTVKAILEEFGQVDILVNNAGIVRDGLAMRMSSEDFRAVLDVNLTGAFHMIRACLPLFIRRRAGSIVNITSVSGMMGNPGQANYAASKAGLIGLTKTLAKEYASRGVTCNAVAPGFIETEMTAAMPAPALEAAAGAIPAKRLGRPEDIAAAALFLASDGASYITGEVLKVDGGLYI